MYILKIYFFLTVFFEHFIACLIPGKVRFKTLKLKLDLCRRYVIKVVDIFLLRMRNQMKNIDVCYALRVRACGQLCLRFLCLCFFK
jgi:hypothetical protein